MSDCGRMLLPAWPAPAPKMPLTHTHVTKIKCERKIIISSVLKAEKSGGIGQRSQQHIGAIGSDDGAVSRRPVSGLTESLRPYQTGCSVAMTNRLRGRHFPPPCNKCTDYAPGRVFKIHLLFQSAAPLSRRNVQTPRESLLFANFLAEDLAAGHRPALRPLI